MRAPRAEYVLALPPIADVTVHFMFEGITATDWWRTIPWEVVNPFCVGILFALILNDLRRPSSWLRENWRDWRSSWVLGDIVIASKHNPTRNTLRAKVMFRREIRSGRLNLYGTGLVGANRGQRTLLFSWPIVDRVADEVMWFELGSIMVPGPGWTPRPSVWGYDIGPEDKQTNVYRITDKQNYLLELEIGGYSYHFEARRIENDWHVITYHDALRIVEAA